MTWMDYMDWIQSSVHPFPITPWSCAWGLRNQSSQAHSPDNWTIHAKLCLSCWGQWPDTQASYSPLHRFLFCSSSPESFIHPIFVHLCHPKLQDSFISMEWSAKTNSLSSETTVFKSRCYLPLFFFVSVSFAKPECSFVTGSPVTQQSFFRRWWIKCAL